MRDTRSYHSSGANDCNHFGATTARVLSVARMVSPTQTIRLMARTAASTCVAKVALPPPSFDESSLFEAGEHGLEEQILSVASNEPCAKFREDRKIKASIDLTQDEVAYFQSRRARTAWAA